jgi:purine-nucleoside phosphorylase
MKPLEKRVDESTEYIRERIDILPRIGLILGSGLGDFADTLPSRNSLSMKDIPNYPSLAVEGHKGNLVFANLHNKPILAFQGRTHFYESNSVEMVLFPVYVAGRLGVDTLVVTNAAGGVSRSLKTGDLMLITDQINLTNGIVNQTPASATAPNGLYDKELIGKVAALATSSRVPIKKGVYAGVKGPSYETAAEVEMIRRFGGDAVGMSTVLEVSLANRLAIKVLGLSCITNFATGIRNEKLSHSEVTMVGNTVKESLRTLLSETIRTI